MVIFVYIALHLLFLVLISNADLPIQVAGFERFADETKVSTQATSFRVRTSTHLSPYERESELDHEKPLALLESGGDGGGVTTCPPGQDLVKFCIDSGIEISTAGGWTPPQTDGAAGPKSLIGVANSWIECRWKENNETNWKPGQVIFSASLKEFFASLLPQDVTDPKILYDVHSDS
jgi:hypothetical protein